MTIYLYIYIPIYLYTYMPDYKLATKQKRNFKLFHARGVVPVSPCLGRGSQDKFLRPWLSHLLHTTRCRFSPLGPGHWGSSWILLLSPRPWDFLDTPSTWCPPSSTTSPSRYSALAGYLNERGPTLCTTAAAYWRIIGDLANPDSISHSFFLESWKPEHIWQEQGFASLTQLRRNNGVDGHNG